MKKLWLIALIACVSVVVCIVGRTSASNEDEGVSVVYEQQITHNDEEMMRFLATGHSLEAYNMISGMLDDGWEVATQKVVYANEVIEVTDQDEEEICLEVVSLAQFKELEHDDISDIPQNFTERIMLDCNMKATDLVY